jgi:glycosyltransferase involved in cell wall biosynthesis
MKFSIVTPSFRNSEWLKLCIASVADQTGVELEHIVQDSCSDDGTQDWLPHDSRVKAFIEKDGGMYDAVNRGCRRASGDILAYLNCDEQYLPESFRVVANFFANQPDVDVMFGDVLLVDEEGGPVSYRRAVLPHRVHTRLVHLGTLSCAMFFRRWIVDEGILFDHHWKAIGDAVWIDRLLARGVRMARVPKPLATFTLTGRNLGATEVSRDEAVAWAAQADAPRRWMRLPAVLLQRVRKAFAGAYRRRTLEYDIYTVASPERRIRIRAENLGFRWPHEYGVRAPA